MSTNDPNYPLVHEAKSGKYSLIPKSLAEEDVLQIWVQVSQFVIRQLIQQKAVNMPGLGMFSVLQCRLDLGNNRSLVVQRPIFMLAEKFAKTHALTSTKYQSSGEIPVVQLNFAVISMEMGLERDVVEICIKEILSAFNRAVNTRKNVDLTFQNIGRLVIKDGKAKMKFTRDFLKTMDGTGTLALSPLTNYMRPRTSDTFISRESVMSSSNSFRPNTFVLPRINARPATVDTCCTSDRPPSVISNHGGGLGLTPLDPLLEQNLSDGDEPSGKKKEAVTFEDEHLRPNSRVSESWINDQVSFTPTNHLPSEVLAFDGGMSMPDLPQHRRIKTDLKPTLLKTIGDDADVKSKVSSGGFGSKSTTVISEVKKPDVSCCHTSGQELCYLCHQRQRRNVPISFAEEKSKAEQEQDRILQQYQQMKDQQFYDQEQRYIEREKAICKKVAQFNLKVSEDLKNSKELPEFRHSYIFNRRGITPQRFLNQEEYSKELGEQCKIKSDRNKKVKDDQDSMDKSEQRNLAQELAQSRKSFLKQKVSATKSYQHALYMQVKNQPFRFPRAEPDSEGPIFGKSDVTPDKVAEMRKRSKEVLNHQLNSISEKKAKNKHEKDSTRASEIEMLKRARKDLKEDSYNRFQVTNGVRKGLENSWIEQNVEKQKRDAKERKHHMESGLLLLDQCDKYSRCLQCKRCCDNIGTSNVWRESRYIPGSRLMV